jgi:plastocyanin
MPTPRVAKLVGSLALLLAGAGCSHTVDARAGAVRIVVTEYRLVPQSIRVRPGQLTIYVHNDGRLTHNLTVTRGPHTTGDTQPILPGQMAQLTVTLMPGKYFMSSTVLSDRDLGIYGTLEVTR